MSASSRVGPSLAELIATHGAVQVMPTSFAQRRFWVLDQLDEGSAYTLPAGIRLQGTLNVSALEGALNVIVARHEALRTVFAVEGDEPVQVVLPALQVPLPLEDLSALSQPAREGEVTARANANANAPFDLAVGPLLRASLLRLADNEHVLLLALHHIVADGWSIGLLFGELEVAYAALTAGLEPALPALDLQYPDYAVWQRRVMQGAAATRQIAYWDERLRNVSLLELPTDRPRPAVQTLNGSHRELTIDGEVAEGIRVLARREGATPFMGFLAAFFVLLQRYSGQSDLVVGSITSGRRRSEVEPVIGLFLNTLAIRVDAAPEQSFLDLLRRVRESAAEAYANEDVPFEHVVDAVQPVRDRSRSPIFQVAFQLLETLAREIKLPGLTASRVSGSKNSAKFDLTLMLHAAPRGGLRAVLEYNSDLFDADTIDRMLLHYVTVLSGIARDAGASVARLPLLSADEYTQVTGRWNVPATPLPHWTAPARILTQAALNPSGVALRAGETTLTYGELARRSAAVAQHLATLGIGVGDRVAICMDRSCSMVVAMLGVHRAGAAYVPLDAAHPLERLAHVLGDANVRAVLTDAASIAHLPPANAPVLELEAFEHASSDSSAFTAPAIDAESPAYVIYTSGSTGKPKGVVVPHRALANFLASMAEQPGLTANDILVAVTTVAFDIAGLELWLPLTTGARVEIASRAVVSDGVSLCALLDATAREAGTGSGGVGNAVMQATPATWSLLLEAGWKGASNLVMLCGGEAWPPRLADALLQRGGALWNVYGPTETTIWSARHKVTASDDVPLGEPLANTSLFVLEPTGEPAPLGVPGELWIGGAGLALGYHERADLTAERFVAHPRFGRLYRTGDRARRRANGNLEYLGRLDDQIKLRGFRIELGEIESVLAAQPGVTQAVVALRRDAGEPQLVGYVVLQPSDTDRAARLAALLPPLRRALPEYMVPTALLALEALPLSPSGKVDRRALPAPDNDATNAGLPYVSPRTPLEQQIAGVWADVLSREQVSVEDDFFALGGHSLLAMRVVARLAAVLPVRLTIGALFEARTVAALAALVERKLSSANGAATAHIMPRGNTDPAPLSYAQELVWLYEQMNPGTAAYHVPMARRVRGALNVGALGEAFEALVVRHESLRTRFVETAGVVRQLPVTDTPVVIAQHDLRAWPEETREREATRVLQQAALRPFDLSVGTQPRVVLVSLADNEALLLVVVHHVVFDGASAGVLMSELATLYAAALQGRAPELAPLPIQLADFATWERREVASARLEPVLAYWRAKLHGAPSGIDLPTDFQRSAENVGPGARHAIKYSVQTRDAVRTLAATHGVTTFVALAAAFQALLHRYSGQGDVVVGTAVAGRESAGTAGLVGYLSNTLALRAEFSDALTFSELLQQTHDNLVGALNHQDVPYEKLVRDLRAGSPANEHALFRIMFTLQDSDVKVPRLGSATLEPLGIDLGAAKFDLTVSAVELVDGIELVVEYRTDLFRADTIARMFDHFNVLLTAACRAPESRVSRLPLLTGSERRSLLGERHSIGTEAAQVEPVHKLVAAQAQQTPHAVAVADAREVLTYEMLLSRAASLAVHLVAAGASQTRPVAVCLPRSARMTVSWLAALQSGAPYIPLDARYPAERLRFMVEDSGASAILFDNSTIELAAEIVTTGTAVLNIDTLEARVVSHSNASPLDSADSLAYIIYTSGSTGQPKGVAIPHRGLSNLCSWHVESFDLQAGARSSQLAGPAFDAATWETWPPLVSGGSLHFPDDATRLDVPRLKHWLAEEKIEVAFIPTPLAEIALVDAWPAPLALRTLLVGGDRLHRHPASKLPFRLVNNYGPTECSVVATSGTVPIGGDGAPTIGRPITNTRAYVLDSAGEILPIGIPGELWVGGAGVAREYLNRPELTAEVFVKDPFSADGSHMYRTGDRVRRLPSGELEYLGRFDFQVKIRGFRIELGEIETTLARHSQVREVVVVARADGGELRLVAYLVAEGPAAISAAALRSYLLATLPAHMVPSAFVWMTQLPITPNGKVDRNALPAPTDDDTEAARPYVAPRTELEAQIAAVWSAVLGRERVSVVDDFFELGGHSLLAMQIVAGMAEVLPVRLTISALFEARTVAALAVLAVQKLAALDAAASSDDELAAMLAELEGLSDEDAATMLNTDSPERS